MNGILIVDKPQGMTSHDVVGFIRKKFGFKKVGHAGTLDPMATGVLVILVGSMTKSSSLFMADDKEYEAILTLGAVSDTCDAWGKITPTAKNTDFSTERIKEVFNVFLGRISQRVPMYSSVRFKGRKLYELARQGLVVDVKPRNIFIKKLEILKIAIPEISFRILCSKGTYVRQLCVDIGESLGCGAYLSQLRRTRSGRFTVGEAVRFEELKDMGRGELSEKLKCK